jgi:pimeloyl-ACP methyl ester carboxylesterase
MSAVTRHSAGELSYLASRDGSAVPVVLLHGIGSNARSFEPLMHALQGRARTLAWDAPGYGQSQPLTIAWPDASDYAAALGNLLDDVEIARCVLLGHSLGALVAARFSLEAPERVAALVLASPALGYGVKKDDVLPGPVAARIEELDRLGPEKFAAARSPGLLADAAARPDVLVSVMRAMAAVCRPGYDQAARLLAGGRLLEDAAKLTVPTAVVVGMQDRITPPENVRRVFAALPEVSRHRYREIENAGHAVCQEQASEVARAIAEFVDDEANAHA